VKDAFEPIVTIAVAIVGVAILAVLVSQKSNTAGVLAAAGSAFSNSLSAATAPVTGASAAPVNNIGGGSTFGATGNFNLPAL
jgi:PRD1 phage membrane DNA delivery